MYVSRYRERSQTSKYIFFHWKEGSIIAPPRKYLNKFVTSTTLEQKKADLLNILGIEVTYCTNFGADILIREAIKNSKNVPKSAIELWQEVEKLSLQDIKEYIRQREAGQQTLEKMVIDVREEQKRIRKIKVYNRVDERKEIILETEFDPVFHQILVYDEGVES